MQREPDVAVVGGGLSGSAIAFGLAREGKRVIVLDEGDVAKRASSGNFALVWVQGKGLGMPAYTGWTMRSSNDWAQLHSADSRRRGRFDRLAPKLGCRREAFGLWQICALRSRGPACLA
jgi:hypothetical protein